MLRAFLSLPADGPIVMSDQHTHRLAAAATVDATDEYPLRIRIEELPDDVDADAALESVRLEVGDVDALGAALETR